MRLRRSGSLPLIAEACEREEIARGASAWAALSFACTSPLPGRGRPPTFFVLPKKVGKERRANDAGRYATALCCSPRRAAKEG